MDNTYKAQYMDSVSLCWKDIQKRYPSKQHALAAGTRLKPGMDIRVVEITRTSRTFGV